MMRPAVLLLAVLLGVGAASAQSLPDILEDALERESRLLDQELARYQGGRRSEAEALERLRTLTREMDRALADPSATVDELRRRESELAAARSTALAELEEAASIRRSAYDRMDRLAEIGADLEAARERQAAERSLLEGEWRVTFEEAGLRGVFDFEGSGALVTGTFRMANGAQGSLRGTFAGDRLELQRIDAGLGFDAVLRAVVDRATGRLEGTWEKLEMAGGAPAVGRWRAERSRD